MPVVAARVKIDASTERVWQVLADFGVVSQTNPGVSTSHLTSEEPTGVGATRHCDLTFSGATTEERIVRWDEGKGLGIDIYDGKGLPFSKASARSGCDCRPPRSGHGPHADRQALAPGPPERS